MDGPEFHKPRLPGYLVVRPAAPNAAGEDMLVFRSERRTIRLAGHSLAEFFHHVLPLLNGQRTIAEIAAATTEHFALADLRRALGLLAANHLLEEGDDATPGEGDERRAPQQNFFAELGAGRDFARSAQARLAAATVTIFGASGAGAQAALALAAAGVGVLRVCDALPVTPTDLYLAPLFQTQDVGTPRVEALQRAVWARSARAALSMGN